MIFTQLCVSLNYFKAKWDYVQIPCNYTKKLRMLEKF